MELRSENLGQKRKIQKLTQDLSKKKALESVGSSIIGNPRDEESSAEEQAVEEEPMQIQSLTARREREREMMFQLMMSNLIQGHRIEHHNRTAEEEE